MIEIFVAVIGITLIILISIVLKILCKIKTRIYKIHTINSINSREIEKINKLMDGKDSTFNVMANKIDGVHTVLSTYLVKGLKKVMEEE